MKKRDPEKMPPIARRIWTIMREKGLTTAALAREAKVSPGGLWNLFDGDTLSPTAATLEAIAPVLGVSIQELLGQKQGASPDNYENLFGRMLKAMQANGTIDMDDEDIAEAARSMADVAEISAELEPEEVEEQIFSAALRLERRRQRKLRAS